MAKGGSMIRKMIEEPKSSAKFIMVESDSSSDNDEIDLIELINTLVREWKTIFGIMLLCTAIALAYALYSKEIF